jgi:hypothetical protein
VYAGGYDVQPTDNFVAVRMRAIVCIAIAVAGQRAIYVDSVKEIKMEKANFFESKSASEL